MNEAAVVIPCYNEAQRFDGAAFERFVQAHGGYRFVLVDDGSSDGTGAVLERLEAALPERFEVLRLEREVLVGLRALGVSPPGILRAREVVHGVVRDAPKIAFHFEPLRQLHNLTHPALLPDEQHPERPPCGRIGPGNVRCFDLADGPVETRLQLDHGRRRVSGPRMPGEYQARNRKDRPP